MSNPYITAFTHGAALDPENLRDLGRRFRFYAMFIIPRSGSTWLTELARNTGLLGCPQEWLNVEFCCGDTASLGCPPPSQFGTFEINAYMNAFSAFSASPNGVAGIQLGWPQVQHLEGAAKKPLDFSFLTASFYLRRRDVLAQAVSLYRSSVSGFFHSYQNDEDVRAKFEGAIYDGRTIAIMLQHLVDCEVEFESLFVKQELSPVRLIYEDIQANPGDALRAMTGALNIDEDVAAMSSAVTKISDARNMDWADQFIAEHREFVAAQLARRPALNPSAGRAVAAERLKQAEIGQDNV